jgi:nucleoside-diphosphate-sugar epimerase
MIRPAVFGTENVLASVSRTPSVRAVVLTASTVCVWSDPTERGRGHVFTEDDWNATASASTYPYFYAKTQAERRAYELHEATSGGCWRLVSLNPGSIWGPPTSSRTDGESVGQMADLLSGALWPWAPPLGCGVVDVRDVAAAHCLAAVMPTASGRHLLNASSEAIMTTAARILRKAYPKRWLPPLKPPLWSLLAFGPMLGLPTAITRATYYKKPVISTAKAARELGLVDYIPVQQSVLDMAEDVLAKRMVQTKLPKALPVMLIQLAVAALLVFTGHQLYRLVTGGLLSASRG